MAKATTRNSTQRKTPPKNPDKKALRKLRGLSFINASFQRKVATEPDLKRELKMRRRPEDVENLVALYDAYNAAINVILGVVQQPRAMGIEDVLDAEWNYLIAKAWTVAEHLATIRPEKSDRERFVHTLVDCAFQMGANADEAASVFRDAMTVELSRG